MTANGKKKIGIEAVGERRGMRGGFPKGVDGR